MFNLVFIKINILHSKPYYNTNETHRDYIIMIYLFKQKINVTPYSKRDAMVNNWQNLYHRLRNTGDIASVFKI